MRELDTKLYKSLQLKGLGSPAVMGRGALVTQKSALEAIELGRLPRGRPTGAGCAAHWRTEEKDGLSKRNEKTSVLCVISTIQSEVKKDYERKLSLCTGQSEKT